MSTFQVELKKVVDDSYDIEIGYDLKNKLVDDIEKGFNLVAAHIDSPRLDLKQIPLYEDGGMGFLKTHYYGGVKKYQWTAIPLALHGVMIKADGTSVRVSIGEKADEPKFVITDLLPHLGKEQGARTLSDGIRGEELNILIGSRPFKDDESSENVKLNILCILNERVEKFKEKHRLSLMALADITSNNIKR